MRSSSRKDLLDLDLRANLGELGLDLLGLFLGNAFLQGLGGSFHDVLGFLQAQAGNNLDSIQSYSEYTSG